MSKLSLRQLFLDDKYLVMHSIGSGHFGDIRVAKNIETNVYFAVKLENAHNKTTKLYVEKKIYEKISKQFEQLTKDEKEKNGGDKIIYGFPKIVLYGTFENYNYLIMELLGYNLETLYNFCNRRFTLKCITMIGIQILSRLEFIHSCDIIFRDVKPENFVIGKESVDRGKLIYMLDFGLSKELNDNSFTNHSKIHTSKKVVGTSRYMSINAHKGKDQSQRDDLESLAYILIYFSKGSLPWQGITSEDIQEKYRKILEIKTSTEISTLCNGIASEFRKFLVYIKHLNFEEKPNYKHLHDILYGVLTSKSEICDWKFDWEDSQTIRQSNSLDSFSFIPNSANTLKTNFDVSFSNSDYSCICCGKKKNKAQ